MWKRAAETATLITITKENKVVNELDEFLQDDFVLIYGHEGNMLYMMSITKRGKCEWWRQIF